MTATPDPAATPAPETTRLPLTGFAVTAAWRADALATLRKRRDAAVLVDALTRAGARVLTVPVYRWAPPAEPARLGRMVEAIAARQVDAVTFTSAPAVCSVLAAAEAGGCRQALVDATHKRPRRLGWTGHRSPTRPAQRPRGHTRPGPARVAHAQAVRPAAHATGPGSG